MLKQEKVRSGVAQKTPSLSEPRGIKAISLRKERYFQLARNTLLTGNTAVDFSIFKEEGRRFELVVGPILGSL